MGCGASKSGGAAAVAGGGQPSNNGAAISSGASTAPDPNASDVSNPSTAAGTSPATQGSATAASAAASQPPSRAPSSSSAPAKAAGQPPSASASRAASRSSLSADGRSLGRTPSTATVLAIDGGTPETPPTAAGPSVRADGVNIAASVVASGGRSESRCGAAAAPAAAREVWHCALSLAFLRRFVADTVQPGWTTYDILKRVVLPATEATKCRYVDTLPARCSSTLTFFVSYAWSMPFTTLVALLEHHLHAADPDQVFCWVDVLAINQHPGRQQARDLQDLEEAVRLARGTLVCLDPDCTPFSRIWCLFEWWTTLTVRGLRHLVFLSDPATRRRMGQLYRGIDVRRARATVASDRDRILAAIGDELDLVNAQLKLIFLLEPYDTASAVAAAASPSLPPPSSAGDATAPPASADVWPATAISRWLGLAPDDKQYRSLAIVGPAGCGKSYGAAAYLAAVTAAEPGTAPPVTAPHPTATNPNPTIISPGETHPSGVSVTAPPQPQHQRRAVAVHFCRTGDAASLDPLVMVRSLAFQLACQTRGSFAAFLQKRYLGLTVEALQGISRLDTAFNVLLLNPLAEMMPPPPAEDEPPMPEWRRRQQEAAAAAAPSEVVLLVDGVDEAEGPTGRPHDNRALMALRDLFAQLPPRVRLLVTLRPAPGHILRTLAFKFDPWVTVPPPAATLAVGGPSRASSRSSSSSARSASAATTTAATIVSTGPGARPKSSSLSSSTSPEIAAAATTTTTAAATASFSRLLTPHDGAGRNWILEALQRGLPPPPSPPPTAQAPTAVGAAATAPSQPAASLPAAYASLFAHHLARLTPDQRRGVAALLELLLAAPEPPSLHCITTLGLVSFLEHLPAWGLAFRVPEGSYRLMMIHRSLREWLQGGGGDGSGGGEAATAAAAVLGAAGVGLVVGRGHSRLADWVLQDLRSSRRPQSYSLRYAILHLSSAAAATAAGGGGEDAALEGGDASAGAPGAPRLSSPGARSEVTTSRSVRREERVRQLDELMLDFDYWRQVYDNRLGTAVLRDLTMLPGLESPTARDVVRMIRRDHPTLERDPDLVHQLAFETPLTSSTRAAAAAAAAAAAGAAAAAAAAAAARKQARSSNTGSTASPLQPCQEGREGEQEEEAPCRVVAPVYTTWPPCLATAATGGTGAVRAGVMGARFSQDGAIFAAATNASSVVLHDSSSGEVVMRLRGHIDYVKDVTFVQLPAAPAVAAAAAPGRAGTEGHHLLVASAGSDKTIRLWEPVTGEQLACLHRHERHPTAVCASADGRHLASTDEEGGVILWRMGTSDSAAAAAAATQALHILKSHEGRAAFCCCFSPDGAELATGGGDGCVRMWDVATGAQVGVVEAKVTSASPDPDRGTSEDATIRPRPPLVKCVAYSPPGTTLLIGMSGGEIGVWSCPVGATTTTGPSPPPLPPPSPNPLPVPPSPPSAVTATAVVAAIPGARSRPVSGINPPGATPAATSTSASASAAPAPSAREADSSPSRWSLRLTLRDHTADVEAVVAARDERRAYSSSTDKTVRVWDLVEGSQLAVLYGHSDYVSACDLSYDGRLLLSGSSDGTVRIWDAEAAATAPAPQQHALSIMQMAVAPNNGYVATASSDQTVCIWKLPQLQPQPAAAAVAADGPAAPSASGDAHPRLSDATASVVPAAAADADAAAAASAVATGVSLGSARESKQGETPPQPGVDARPPQGPSGREDRSGQDTGGGGGGDGGGGGSAGGPPSAELGLVIQLKGHTGNVSCVAVAPDEVTLASGSYDRSVRVYRLDKPSVPELVLTSAHKAFVMAVGFDPWGTRLASGGGDGTLALWDAAAWQERHFNAVAADAASGGATAAPEPWMRPLATESFPGLTTVWHLACSPVQYVFAAGHNAASISLFDGRQPDQQSPVSGSGSGSLLYAVYQPTDEGGAPATGHVYGVGWSPDGTWIAGGYSGHRGGHARVWDITSGQTVADILAHEKDVWGVAFDPLDRNMLATCSYDSTAAIWALSDLRCPARVATLRGHRGWPRSIAFLTRGGGGGDGGGGGGGGGGGCGSSSQDSAVSRVLITTGTDATVRVWSYREAVRRREVSYMCPWALTG